MWTIPTTRAGCQRAGGCQFLDSRDRAFLLPPAPRRFIAILSLGARRLNPARPLLIGPGFIDLVSSYRHHWCGVCDTLALKFVEASELIG